MLVNKYLQTLNLNFEVDRLCTQYGRWRLGSVTGDNHQQVIWSVSLKFSHTKIVVLML